MEKKISVNYLIWRQEVKGSWTMLASTKDYEEATTILAKERGWFPEAKIEIRKTTTINETLSL